MPFNVYIIAHAAACMYQLLQPGCRNGWKKKY